MAEQAQQQNDRALKVSEVAVIFGVTSETVREWLRDGTLKGMKIGKGHYWRVMSSSVVELAQQRHGDLDED
jgi:excisionase family DNA binding protein